MKLIELDLLEVIGYTYAVTLCTTVALTTSVLVLNFINVLNDVTPWLIIVTGLSVVLLSNYTATALTTGYVNRQGLLLTLLIANVVTSVLPTLVIACTLTFASRETTVILELLYIICVVVVVNKIK